MLFWSVLRVLSVSPQTQYVASKMVLLEPFLGASFIEDVFNTFNALNLPAPAPTDQK